jgi:hypothetical protein
MHVCKRKFVFWRVKHKPADLTTLYETYDVPVKT